MLNLATFAPPWMAALPGLGYWSAETVTQASTASTYLAPGGPGRRDRHLGGDALRLGLPRATRSRWRSR